MALNAGVSQSQTTSRILNKLNYAMSEIAEDIGTAATGDIMLMIDVSDGYKVKYADSANIFELMGITASAAAINAAATGTRGTVAVTDAASYAVLAANSGKLHILPNFTATCTLTLPTAAAGLEFEFIGAAVAADAQNWVFAAGVPYLGGVTFVDNDAGAGADEMHAGVYPNGSSNDNMTIVTPAAGTYIRVVCDGTNWIVNGFVNSATVPTFGD